jgi:hypothetical protein
VDDKISVSERRRRTAAMYIQNIKKDNDVLHTNDINCLKINL